MNKIKVGDEVQVITGKAKGTRGKVLKLIQGGVSTKVIVEGVNMVKKHVKANPNAGVQGGISEKEAAIDISNVMLFDSESGKPSKVAIKIVDGKKERTFKRTGKAVA